MTRLHFSKNILWHRDLSRWQKKEKVQKNFEDSLGEPRFIAAEKIKKAPILKLNIRAMNRAATFLKKYPVASRFIAMTKPINIRAINRAATNKHSKFIYYLPAP